MKRPKTSESKYWENDRFRHLLFIEDLEDYTTALEEQIAKNCVIPAVVGRSEQLVCDCTHTQVCKICAISKDIDWGDAWDEEN
jgi:hypothetical protein